MSRKHISLSPALNRTIQAQVELGRYKDFSAALQDAAWNYFIGAGSPFEDYGVTSAEVEKKIQQVSRAIAKERKAGKLKPWKP